MEGGIPPFLLLCLCGGGMIFPAEATGQQYSSCRTSGTVLEGFSATVVCHFNRPFQNFVVYRLPSSQRSEKANVAVCTWKEGKRDCNLLDGYKVITTANRDQATIEIQSAQQSHSGQYFCKTQPAANDNATSCTLTVQSNTVRKQGLLTCSTDSPVQVGQEASIVCKFSKSVGATGIILTKHGTSPGEIMRCDRNRRCELKMEGYNIAEKTDTFIKVSIPAAKTHNAGDYTCTSTSLGHVSGKCALDIMEEKDSGESSISPTTVHMILVGCSAFFVTAAAALLIGTFCRARKKGFCCKSPRAHNRDSVYSTTPCLIHEVTQ